MFGRWCITYWLISTCVQIKKECEWTKATVFGRFCEKFIEHSVILISCILHSATQEEEVVTSDLVANLFLKIEMFRRIVKTFGWPISPGVRSQHLPTSKIVCPPIPFHKVLDIVPHGGMANIFRMQKLSYLRTLITCPSYYSMCLCYAAYVNSHRHHNFVASYRKIFIPQEFKTIQKTSSTAMQWKQTFYSLLPLPTTTSSSPISSFTRRWPWCVRSIQQHKI